MRGPVALAVGLLLSGALAAPAAAATFTIRTKGAGVSTIGSFAPQRDPSLASATRLFAPPTRRRLLGNDAWQVDGARGRPRILFANFGLPPEGQTVCSPRGGYAQSFTARGRSFRTWRGLRVGDASSSIPERHPGARFRGGSWWLRTARSPYGDNEEFGVLRASVRGGRVSALVG